MGEVKEVYDEILEGQKCCDKKALSIYLDDYGLDESVSNTLFEQMDTKKKGNLTFKDFKAEWDVFNKTVFEIDACVAVQGESTLLKRGAPRPDLTREDDIVQLSRGQFDVCQTEFEAVQINGSMGTDDLHTLLQTQIGRELSDIEADVAFEAMAGKDGLVTFESYMAGVWGKFCVVDAELNLVPAAAAPNCCDAFPEGYKNITPAEGPDGPDYLKGCKLVHLTLKRGQKDVPHYHPIHYMYVIKGGKLRITGAPDPSGETIEPELVTGAGMIMPAGERVVENIGEDDVEVLFIEVGEQNGRTPDGHLACFEAEPDHYKVVAEDEDWMVVTMSMQPGEEDKPHSHREHVVYVLSEGELSIWGGKEKTDPEKPDLGPVPVKPGTVLPVPTGFHIVKNTGSVPVIAVFFERKR